jgi:8-oxo-dGTP pyrophosphatase MutT (NUDIX family)
MTDQPPPPVFAATLILMREMPSGSPEIMMIERAASMVFAAGARVFPGGRLDPDDWDIARASGRDDVDEAAHRIAAIRETIEEAGLPVGLDPMPGLDVLQAIRDALAAGTLFSRLLDDHGLTLDLDSLIPFARWCPPSRLERRTFDTRFYAARATDLPMIATADGSETVHLVWTSADQALADAEAGRALIIFPTLCNLERLAQLPDFAALTAHVEAYPVQLITPEIAMVEGSEALTIPEGMGYPRTWRALEGLQRG